MPSVDLSSNTFVKVPIPKIDSSVLKHSKASRGKKKKYTPTRMKNAINVYFEKCEEIDDVPSIKGLMIHLGMYRETFYDYLNYPEFSNLMNHAKLIISHWCESDVYRTKGMAAGKIAYMKNVHDWTEKVEQNQNIVQRITTIDEARARIEMLAPKLLELLKSNKDITNQLVIDAAPEEACKEEKSERRV